MTQKNLSTFKSRLEKKLTDLNDEIALLEARRWTILQDIFRLKGRCYHCEKHSGDPLVCHCNPRLSGNASVGVFTKEASRVDS